MAWIRKLSARKELEPEIKPEAGVTNRTGDGGLRFNLLIGSHKVSLTHFEKDAILDQWAKMQAEHEQ